MDRELKQQFDFFNDVRFFPDKINVAINKFDLIDGDIAAKKKKIESTKKEIMDFFKNKKITVNDVFITCGETVEGFEDVETYNDAVAEMLLKTF